MEWKKFEMVKLRPQQNGVVECPKLKSSRTNSFGHLMRFISRRPWKNVRNFSRKFHNSPIKIISEKIFSKLIPCVASEYAQCWYLWHFNESWLWNNLRSRCVGLFLHHLSGLGEWGRFPCPFLSSFSAYRVSRLGLLYGLYIKAKHRYMLDSNLLPAMFTSWENTRLEVFPRRWRLPRGRSRASGALRVVDILVTEGLTGLAEKAMNNQQMPLNNKDISLPGV